MSAATADFASHWPLIHRGAVHAQTLSALAARPFSAALLTGPTGIGKSTLARQVLAEVEADGRRVVHVLALRELREVPLGAFAPALEFTPSGAAGDLSSRLSNVVGSIAEFHNAVLFVDDAPLLDDLSAAAVYQLVRVHKLSCLMTARDEHPLTGAIQRLDHEGILERIGVEPLTNGEVDSLLEQRLGKPVEAESVRSFHRRSAGNPLVVRTLTEAAEEQHTIHETSHGLVVDEPRLPRHVGAIMSEQLATLTAPERHLARLIALAQPVPVELLAETAHVDGLRASGFLVDSSGAISPQLTIFHPLAAQLLVDEMGPVERQQLADEASAVLAAAADEQLRFRGVLLRVRYGLAESAETLAAAAGFAVMVQDYGLARQLALQANELLELFQSCLALGTAESALGSPDAVASFERATALATSEAEHALATLRLGHHFAIRLGQPREAVRRAEEALKHLEDDAARGILDADLVKWRSMAGESLAMANPSAESSDGLARLSALINEAMVGAMLADTVATSAAVATARPLANEYRAQIPFADDLLDLNDFLVLVFNGELGAAEEYVIAKQSTSRGDSRGQWRYTAALIALHTGRVVDAEASARDAVFELERRDFTGLIGAARALHATALAQLGRQSESRELLESLDANHRQDAKVFLQVAEAEAAILVGDGDLDAAAHVVVEAATTGIAHNHLALSALTLYSAVRFGRASAISDQLDGLAATTGSTLLQVLHEHVDAVLSGDPERMSRVAERLDTVGLTASARTLWVEAAGSFGRRGKNERARACLRSLEASGRGLNLLDPIEYRMSQDDALTAREWEVAKAAANRQRSAEIAKNLGVSTRTVDNHLSRIYRKLGVRSRLELASALAELIGRAH